MATLIVCLVAYACNFQECNDARYRYQYRIHHYPTGKTAQQLAQEISAKRQGYQKKIVREIFRIIYLLYIINNNTLYIKH